MNLGNPLCNNACDCETYLTQSKHIKQGQHGICWFVSMLNTILLSDRLSAILKPYIDTNQVLQICQNPDVIVNHLATEVSNKSCVTPACTFDTLVDLGKYTTNQIDIFRSILYEYFSDSQLATIFGSEDHQTGGYGFRVIMPYLVRLGMPSCNIKHTIFNLTSIYSNLFTDPRQIKLARLCQEYLQTVYKCNKNIDIYILTITQNDSNNIDDIKRERDYLYLGKFICFIDNGILFVYKLDAALLSSNNNIVRGSGHAISAITCKNHGFLINSYDPDNVSNKNCSVFHYDWYKWDSNNHFYHTIEQNNTCTGGYMIESSPKTASVFKTKKDEFTFHKNIGTNSLIYVRSIHSINTNQNIESLHSTHLYNTPAHQQEQSVYNDCIKPYLYLINEVALESNIIGITYEFFGYITNIVLSAELSTSILIQRGIVENGMNIYIYRVIVPPRYTTYFANILKECLPDDIMIVQSIINPSHFGLYIQYFRKTINPKLPITPVHGGISKKKQYKK